MADIHPNGGLTPDVSYTPYDPPAGGPSTGALQAEVPQYRPDQLERAMFEIQGEQNLVLAAAAGAVAGAIGAVIWAVVTVVTMFQIGWLAVGIGFLVGAGVRWLGRGTTQVFGVVGGTIALLSVIVGNFLSSIGLLAGGDVSYLETLTQFDYSQTLSLMAATFSPMDLVFYAIAVWEGYRFSIREVTPAEIQERLAAQGVTPTATR